MDTLQNCKPVHSLPPSRDNSKQFGGHCALWPPVAPTHKNFSLVYSYSTRHANHWRMFAEMQQLDSSETENCFGTRSAGCREALAPIIPWHATRPVLLGCARFGVRTGSGLVFHPE